jgi:hypothetical protein
MDARQFDTLTKLLATRTPRRAALAALLAAGVAAHRSPASAQPGCRREGHPCEGNQVCCEGLVCSESGQGSSRRCVAGETREADATTAPPALPEVTTTLPYHVDVSCDYDPNLDQTSCVFVGSADGDAPLVTAVILPVDTVCGDVVDGEYELIDLDNGRGEAYRSTAVDQDERPRCILVFAGRVATASSASYWCETESGTFPAEGEGLSCPQEPLANEISDTTGAVLVYALACPGADAGDDDWYASCSPDPQSREFQLQAASDSATPEPLTATSINEEPARFLLLEPGAYELTEIDATWCRAESDNTNDQGEVLVEAGQHTNVWTFHCATGTS